MGGKCTVRDAEFKRVKETDLKGRGGGLKT